MPIVVALVVLVAAIWGAVWSFHVISAAAGVMVAIVAAVVALGIVVGICAYFWLRWKETARNAHEGDWTHELKRDWGGVKLAAEKRLCELRVGEQRGSYIFADLQAARMEPSASGGWQVALDVKDARQPRWILPMATKKDAHQWGRIFQKAVDQQL